MTSSRKVGMVAGIGALGVAGAATVWALNRHQSFRRLARQRVKFDLPEPAKIVLRGDTESKLQAPPKAIEARSSIVFMGCGASTATPSPACLLETKGQVCTGVCTHISPQDTYNLNNRGNPALLIKHRARADSLETQVQIDIGKTYVSKFQAFHKIFGIRAPDAIFLTHSHADAASGIDEIRNLQKAGDKPMPLYLNQHSYDDCKGSFGYLMERKGPLHVSAIDWQIASDYQGISVGSLDIMTLPVVHGSDPVKGPDEKCLNKTDTWGFAFGGDKNTKLVAYLSDVSAIPKRTMTFLQGSGVDILIIDSLLKDKSIWGHVGLPAAINLAKEINLGKKTPLKVYLTGMGCSFDYSVDKDEIRAKYLADNLDVEMAFDGLQVSIDV